MKVLIIAALLALGSVSQAKTFYVVNGKAATLKEARNAPKGAEILKIQASKVQPNEETGNLKKSADLDAAGLKKAIGSIQ